MAKRNEKALWFQTLTNNKPLMIAGPCSAETPQQVLEIAQQIKDTAKIFRAGIWKPRTRPGGFEGVGAIGLEWLQQVKQETGIDRKSTRLNSSHVRISY